jgi:phenylalanyl-tRNA synthetase beta chain
VSLFDGTHTIFDLEMLANRGDHYCYAGVAREIRGRIGGELTLPQTETLEVGPSPVRLTVESDLCPAYAGTLLEITQSAGSLPPDVFLPAAVAGLHSIAAAADASNVANIELGQPTHFQV